MMRLAKLADYGLVIAATISQAADAQLREGATGHGSGNESAELIKLDWVAVQTGLTVATVRKIMKLLVDGGIVVSVRGVNGGYRLARSADDISLADVLTAVEGQVALTDCCSETRQCDVISSCNVHHNWSVINGTVNTIFESISLREMSGQLTRSQVIARIQSVSPEPGRIGTVQLSN